MHSTLYSISSCLLALDFNDQILVASCVMSTYNHVICDDVVLCVLVTTYSFVVIVFNRYH